MKLYGTLFILFSLTLEPGCMSAPRKATSTIGVSLEQFDVISLGSSTNTINQKLGKPTEIQPVADSINLAAWVYSDNDKIDRATLIFDKTTGALLAKTWRIRDFDRERDIETTLNRYSNAHFKIRNAPWVTDYLPDEAYYVDATLGLSIKIRKKRREVVSVTWTSPK